MEQTNQTNDTPFTQSFKAAEVMLAGVVLSGCGFLHVLVPVSTRIVWNSMYLDTFLVGKQVLFLKWASLALFV